MKRSAADFFLFVCRLPVSLHGSLTDSYHQVRTPFGCKCVHLLGYTATTHEIQPRFGHRVVRTSSMHS
jgi:hypothetical protein